MKIKKEQLIIAIIIGIMFCALTLTIFVQFKTISYTDINALETMQETELRKEITAIKTKYTETLEKLEETNSMIKEYEETINTDKEASVLLESELEKSRNLLGKNPVQGEGIIVTLVDVEVGKYGKITYIDLIELINELKAAGAEAISINDHRIVSTSYVVDLTAGYIGVNGERIVSPYTVKAIGDITYLESGLSQKQYGYIDTKNNEGKYVTLEKSSNIFINAYSGNIKFNYAKEVE
ncbi:MAG: DUF881 domain-containing protein [Clostridia bacterium]|nr:DUF881 domain-containing protein [Clostridia bacterium]